MFYDSLVSRFTKEDIMDTKSGTNMWTKVGKFSLILCFLTRQEACFCCSQRIQTSFVMIGLRFRSWWLFSWTLFFHRKSLRIWFRIQCIRSLTLFPNLFCRGLHWWRWVVQWVLHFICLITFFMVIWCLALTLMALCNSTLSLILTFPRLGIFCSISNIFIKVWIKIKQKILLLGNLCKYWNTKYVNNKNREVGIRPWKTKPV